MVKVKSGVYMLGVAGWGFGEVVAVGEGFGRWWPRPRAGTRR